MRLKHGSGNRSQSASPAGYPEVLLVLEYESIHGPERRLQGAGDQIVPEKNVPKLVVTTTRRTSIE